jgi:hypothetical protein
MRVSEEMLKCVGFVGEGIPGEDGEEDKFGDLCATGFFIGVPSEFPELRKRGANFCYFVTARHVAQDLQNKPAYFLVNKVGGGVTHIDSILGPWWLHPTDKTADVAVLQLTFQGNADVSVVEIGRFATPENIAKYQIGIGDEVFATGLFTPAPGMAKNQPILRHGNIAMMPDEQLQTELGYADVFLVEARSIGGLSGSPVFVRPTINLPIPELECGLKNMLGPAPRALLLGLMHGHWDVRESELNNPQIAHDRQRGVNLGVGIVVPAIKILETINRPELVKIRKETDEQEMQQLKRSVPGMDSAKSEPETQTTPTGAKIPIPTEGQFLNDLTKASRRVKE